MLEFHLVYMCSYSLEFINYSIYIYLTMYLYTSQFTSLVF